VDETYVRVKGSWSYLYRAVDSRGQTIDFLLSTQVSRRRTAEADLTSGTTNLSVSPVRVAPADMKWFGSHPHIMERSPSRGDQRLSGFDRSGSTQ
jgi:hypothetical protein